MIIIFSSNDNLEVLNPCLTKALSVSLLITESPKPKGRGLKIQPNQAHAFAIKNHIATLSPSRFDEDAISEITKIVSGNNIKVGLASAYGKIIPQKVIDLFEFGIINIHPSLLPKYRGPSPISSAILNRDKKSGYTIISIDKGCDTGDIIAQKEIELLPSDSHDDLKDKIFNEVCHDLPKVMTSVLSGDVSPKRQDESLATYTDKTAKTDAQILDTDTTNQAMGKILAFGDWPKAYLVINDKRMVIHKAQTKDGKIEIKLIQPEGKAVMTFPEFRNGYAKLLTEMPKFVKI